MKRARLAAIVATVAASIGAMQSHAARTPSRLAFTIRCTETTADGTRTLYEATIDGPPATDFDLSLHDARFTLDASFVNEPTTNGGTDIRLHVESRRRFGTSPNGLPLWEEARQEHRVSVELDQQLELLPFGGAGPRGLLKFVIEPAASAKAAGAPIAIALHADETHAIRVYAHRAPHWYTVDAALERDGVIVARASTRSFRDEPTHLALGTLAAVDLRVAPPPYDDPRRAARVTFDARGAGGRTLARDWEGITDGAPMRYALKDGSVLVFTARPE